MIKWDVIITYFPALLEGALITLEVSLLTMVIATIAGTFLALMRISSNRTMRSISMVYMWIMRGTPLLLVLFFVYYAFPSWGIRLPAFAAAILAMSMNSAAYKGEIIRSGIQAIPRGQIESAMAIGMSYGQTMRRIILPQAVRIIIPPYINNSILLIKNSALVSSITVTDLMLNSQQIYSATYRPVEILGTAGVLYLTMTSLLMWFQMWAEKKLSYYNR
ncbi:MULTISPECIES: amino acid ABC transporter permease [Paenibacillus]|jgi:polar amino acid transport system permease protein|uniref:Amino acid ABC transporter permease n=1 Tax=Paenibacillus baimaensis TaxID=2982185 RepID=A0ABT2UA62_9BACL|nr:MULTISPECIES: amino acid ABC transporter permease [unclassified Paenibacillus]MCU6791485.1 amino acid ABC transporter permease [Paenibacillus sp. WQ 127069]OMF15756.1 ABC transporter permease [Paenibacillus sp. FSL H7-0331]